MTRRTRFTALFEPRTLARVRALAAIRQVPVYQVFGDAAEAHYAALPAQERAEVDRLVKVWERRERETKAGRGGPA